MQRVVRKQREVVMIHIWVFLLLPLIVARSIMAGSVVSRQDQEAQDAVEGDQKAATTVGWVPIEEESSAIQFDSTTITTTTTSTTSSSLPSTSSPSPSTLPPSSLASTTASYTTTSFKDAQIQYRPLSAAAKSSNEDVPMPMIDIQLPFNNHTHIVTWLDPKTMKPKSKPERSAMQKEDAESKPKKAKRRGRPRIYNIRPAPLFPVVMLKIYETDHPNVTLMVNDKSSSRVKRGAPPSWQKEPSTTMPSSNHYCGGDFTDLSGILRSPGYPLYYPNNKECRYRIALPDNYTIKFSCDDFGLQGRNGTECAHDVLTILEGTSSLAAETNDTAVIGKFCGAQGPAISTDTNKMTVVFKSNHLFRYQGFKCRYRAIQPNGIAVINSFGDTGADSEEDPLNYLNGAGDQVVYANNFFSGQTSECQNAATHTETASNGDDPNYTGANLFGGLWSGTCGTSNIFQNSVSSRIVGGEETAEHQYPWMVSILRECGNEFCHVCGGTIISPAWILTSAHCVSSVPIEEMGILLGDHNLYELSYEQKFVRAAEKVTHPDFSEPTILNNDIGLVRLENDVAFTKFISPLCLPPEGETGFGTSAYGDGNSSTLDTSGLNIVGHNATVIGWGAIDDGGSYPDGLHEVDVQILNNQVCSDLYGPMITETMMCTSGSNGRGSCYGDSGGPALVKDVDGSFVQVGIVSFGASNGCEDGYPSGQVLVHKFIDWIQHVTGLIV